MKVKLILLFSLLTSFKLIAQTPGSLDSTFGVNGKVVTSIYGVDDRIFAIEVQPDNKIVVAGEVTIGNQSEFVIARYETNGTLDSTFGTGGYTITSIDDSSEVIRDIQLQTDGKIVAVGEAYIDTGYTVALARYNVNGSIDSTFGQNGIIIKSIPPGQNFSKSLTISPSGKIYVAASTYSNKVIIKFDENGNMDSTFGNSGICILPFAIDYLSTVEMTNDNKIICGGHSYSPDFAFCKVDSLGFLDSTFGNNNVVLTDLGYYVENIVDIEVLTNNKIVIGGAVANAFQNWDYVVAQYNNDGSIDSSFGTNGRIIKSFTNGRDILHQIAIQSDGKIVAAGYCGNIDFGMIRCNTNGTIDSSFGNNGKVVTDYNFDFDLAFSMDIQTDSKILLAGETRDNGIWKFALARYFSGLNVGIVDFEKQSLPMQAYPNPVTTYATLTYNLPKDESITIKLFDITGKEIKTFIQGDKKLKGSQTEYLFFDQGIQKGIYLLSIGNGYKAQSIKVVKD